MFLQFFARRREKALAHHLYKELVEQARLPVFYTAPYAVSDTMDGRFEMILLHLFLVDQWLAGDSENVRLRRFLRETLVSDMDRSLREMGVGDMSISKEMKKIGAALLGRMASYEQSVQEGADMLVLKETIARNISEGNEIATDAFVSYVEKCLNHLMSVPLGQGLNVTALFPQPSC
jgi:cytochrome b pre-mRNA-processing protein 3